MTNIDDIVILALFFGRAGGDRAAAMRVVVGHYAGFAAILAAALLGALGAGLLPEHALPYLGLLPLALGLRAGALLWRERAAAGRDVVDPAVAAGAAEAARRPRGVGVLSVASVTFANGGDNVGVYVPVFATAGAAGIAVYVVVFLALVAVWCLAGAYVAGRPLVARALSRWGHVLLPIVLAGIGVLILVEGHAFGL